VSGTICHLCLGSLKAMMATGRDASDVAMTTSFGVANLTQFTVVSEDLTQESERNA
jgi:hypothetical protein